MRLFSYVAAFKEKYTFSISESSRKSLSEEIRAPV